LLLPTADHSTPLSSTQSEITTLSDRDHTFRTITDAWRALSPSAYDRYVETAKTENDDRAERTLKLLGEELPEHHPSDDEEEVEDVEVEEDGVHVATKADTVDLEKVALTTRCGQRG
jgi:hypothetical protein